jgi:ParB family transcriptional regulator, chromosome partitioning protein
MNMLREIRQIEIAQLILRYARTRIERPKESFALAASIDRIGQVIPVVVVKEGASFVLLDGYLRVKALKALGRDTVKAEIWTCSAEEALVEILARAHGRKWDVVEEAALVQELHDHHHLSQGKIASLVGRTQGWVSGRLTLYRTLSEDLMELIRKGAVSTWTATRVIVPIARAMPEHGKILAENLSKASLSTREMARFSLHYQKAHKTQRERMVRDPALFVKSLNAKEEALDAKTLKDGPEGKWVKDLRVVTHILQRLLREIPTLFKNVSPLDRRVLLTAVDDSRAQFRELEEQTRRYDDYRREPTGDCESSRQRASHPSDQPGPQTLTEHRQAGDSGMAGVAQALPV